MALQASESKPTPRGERGCGRQRHRLRALTVTDRNVIDYWTVTSTRMPLRKCPGRLQKNT